jgi:hypothetical protein
MGKGVSYHIAVARKVEKGNLKLKVAGGQRGFVVCERECCGSGSKMTYKNK